MRGRRPTPTHLKLIRGNPGKRAIKPEPEPLQAPEAPGPPDFLSAYACDEWFRVATELHRLGLLSVVDVMPVAAYCQAYARWRTAEETLAEMAKRDQVTSGLMIKSVDGYAIQNPLVRIARDSADSMVKFAGEFGMTPVARARLAGVGFEPPPSKFDGLLGR
jgi:P27 family predicted phage terminase small subunit